MSTALCCQNLMCWLEDALTEQHHHLHCKLSSFVYISDACEYLTPRETTDVRGDVSLLLLTVDGRHLVPLATASQRWHKSPLDHGLSLLRQPRHPRLSDCIQLASVAGWVRSGAEIQVQRNASALQAAQVLCAACVCSTAPAQCIAGMLLPAGSEPQASHRADRETMQSRCKEAPHM